mgnify:CR=1 FL=1
MINSIRLIRKYYRAYKGQTNFLKRARKELLVFIVILLVISYMFYYIVFIDHCTAVYKYSKYDAEIINISPHQSRQIKGYDFVDNFITYIDISHVKLINSTDDSSLGTLLKVL